MIQVNRAQAFDQMFSEGIPQTRVHGDDVPIIKTFLLDSS